MLLVRRAVRLFGRPTGPALAILAIALIPFLAACDYPDFRPRPELGISAALSDPRRELIDTAGKTSLFVFNPAPNPDESSLHIVQEPEIRVGGRSDHNLRSELWVVLDAVICSDGNLVVIMDGGRRVSVFDSTSRFLQSVSKEGDGSGDLIAPRALSCGHGDTLIVVNHNKLLFFDPRYKFVRGVETRGRVECCFANGGFLEREVIGATEAVRQKRYWPEARSMTTWFIKRGVDSEPLVRLSLEEDDAKEIIFWVDAGHRRVTTPVVPFGRRAIVRLAPGHIVYGIGDRFEYRMFSTSGSLTSVIRAALAPATVGRAQRDSFRAAWLRQARDKRDTLYFSQAYDKIRFPPTLPAFDELLTDEKGNVWIGPFHKEEVTGLLRRAGGASQWWVVFDTNGSLLGTLRIPDRHSVIRFTRGRVILRNVKDDVDGFTWLTVHQIVGLG